MTNPIPEQMPLELTKDELRHVKLAMDAYCWSSFQTYRQYNIEATETMAVNMSALKKIISALEAK